LDVFFVVGDFLDRLSIIFFGLVCAAPHRLLFESNNGLGFFYFLLLFFPFLFELFDL